MGREGERRGKGDRRERGSEREIGERGEREREWGGQGREGPVTCS